MAFFKFRKGADDSPRASGQPPSIEAIRQRAKYRLAGATVLVLGAVIGLPLLFDKQPRPIAVDTPIVIPDKNKVLPLVIPASPAKPTQASADTAAPTSPVAAEPAAQAAAATAPKPAADKLAEQKQPVAQVDKGQAATNTVVKEAPASPKPAATPADANRALALLEGKPADKSADAAAKAPKVASSAAAPAKAASATAERYVVQVGAFSDNARAHEVRVKLERAGVKTYAQTADTKEGRRIRVRAGPFTSKAEADKVADKIKKLNLPAALLTL
ncbi:SPOR domain-containing protein [Rhodoferax sp. U11-2br]|uniref:SPOR domain-containing protein n=1 Tax=Rhodoferax sp. U11-2br TaxID=2838878 RepID=UPI001BE81985|nr:SPOR domain-containing protein [Rhodoferax sp. U11-2br]MBT3067088.1 SPOR domain-containing protein [Rhodoferax sp. U11-2br]